MAGYGIYIKYNFEFPKVKLDTRCIDILSSVAIQLECFLSVATKCVLAGKYKDLTCLNILFNERNYVTEKYVTTNNLESSIGNC